MHIRVDFLSGLAYRRRPPMTGPILPRLFLVVTALGVSLSSVAANPNAWESSRVPSTERVGLARALLNSSRVSVLNYHVSGVRDEATAHHNLLDTANGRAVKRSYYGRAPGGSTRLSIEMLRAIVILVREGYSFRITELAGGSHCSSSRHYDGLAFDIDVLNGREIESGHPTYQRFMQRCRDLGAIEVFGPGTRGHATHLHIGWPRPEES